MKVDKILLSYAGAEFLFLAGGIILLVASLLFDRQVHHSTPTLANAPDIILLGMLPFKGLFSQLKIKSCYELKKKIKKLQLAS
jgi:hypothetical protein